MVINPSSFIHPATEAPTELSQGSCRSWAPPGALSRKTSPLTVPPLRSTRFGSPLVLSRVHWVKLKLVAEITYFTWNADGLLRHTDTSASARTNRRRTSDEKPREIYRRRN
jgi:ATP-dependent DNA ligase